MILGLYFWLNFTTYSSYEFLNTSYLITKFSIFAENLKYANV